MARIFKGVSIVIHAIVIGTISYVQIFDTGLIPSPTAAIAYEMPIVLDHDIPLPSPPRAPASAHNVQPNLAPIAAPDRLPNDSDPEPAPVSREPGVMGGVDGSGGGQSFGIVDNPTPPPHPPPPATPSPVTPVPLGGNIRPPVKVFNVDPVYPDIAKAARKEGIVILEVVIAIDGRVESVRVLRGVPTLDQAAIAAVQQWRFEPARLNGQIIPVVMTVTVNFQLSK